MDPCRTCKRAGLTVPMHLLSISRSMPAAQIIGAVIMIAGIAGGIVGGAASESMEVGLGVSFPLFGIGI